MNIRQTGTGLALLPPARWRCCGSPPLPLGVPGEWAWSRIPVAPGDWMLLALGWFYAGVVGGLYFGLVAVASLRLAVAGRRGNVGLVAGALCWRASPGCWSCRRAPPRPQYALGKSGWVLFYHGHEGYFEQAPLRDVRRPLVSCGLRGPDAAGGLSAPGNASARNDAVSSRVSRLVRGSPGLCDLLERTEPASFRDAMNQIQQAERINRVDRCASGLPRF